MRKDIQFGLTIGGLLLAVLVIYLAVFTHSTKKAQDLALVQGPATQPASDARPAALDVTQAATPGIATSDNVATAKVQTTATTQPAVADSGASSSSTARDWTALLQSGGSTTQPVMMSASVVEPAASETGASASAGLTAPAAGAGVAQSHKVAAGESFYTIAKAVYGDGKYYGQLVDANPTVQANRLRVGMVIHVPALGQTVAADARTADSAKAAADTKGAAGAELDPSKSYRVRPSDTLMAIARKLYGDGQAWEKIYDANRDSIGPNPARLKVDMVLRLPEAPTVAVAN